MYDYVEADNPRAAVELDEQFARRAAQLLTHPMIGRPGRRAAQLCVGLRHR
ncbi:MAG TPA: type II toxin-antitoxin system RelE/ParE family toxin [Roseiarcus sp.]|nr:type II toxin-antitoxin system RelE/ParE family toxin [Roseiarcus sp.]